MGMSASPRVFVASHGHCFDGLASAVAFTKLLSTLRPEIPIGEYAYRACDYRPGDSSVPESALVGEENAILDFRYTPSDKVTYYFDHHATAFAGNEAARDIIVLFRCHLGLLSSRLRSRRSRRCKLSTCVDDVSDHYLGPNNPIDLHGWQGIGSDRSRCPLAYGWDCRTSGAVGRQPCDKDGHAG